MKLSNLTPETRAKAAGLAIVGLIGLGIAATELLSSAFTPAEPQVAWDLRDAPSSGIIIRKPRASLVRPLGSLAFPEGPTAQASLKTREAGALLAGAGPAATARAGAFGRGAKAPGRDDSPADAPGLPSRGGSLQKAAMPGGFGGGSAGSGGFGGGASSARLAPGSALPPGSGAPSGEGALGALMRKAKALIPAGARRLAGVLGGSAGQAFSGSLPSGGFGSAAGFSAAGGGTSAAVEPAGSASTQAGSTGGAVTAAQAALAALAKITDTKDVKRPGEDQGDEEELERFRRLFGGRFAEDGLGIEPPDTALGRCMGRITLGARCRGYTCAANDASGILRGLEPAKDAGFAAAATVLDGVKRDVAAQVAVLQAAKDTVSGKTWSCINCERLNECALQADQKLFNAIEVLGGEKTQLEAALRDLRGNTPAALGSAGSVYVAASHEAAVLDDHVANLLRHIETFGSACVAGVPALVEVGEPPALEPEQAGADAKAEFLALIGPLTGSLTRVRQALTPSWCARHGCAVPDTAEARATLRDHVDTIDVFQDFLMGGDGRAMREAASRLDRARGLMPQGGAARGQSYFSGLFELWNSAQSAEDGARSWRRSAASACAMD